ncbi:NAD(+)/NADH kinase [Patescibacteria group bacterium]
MKKKTSPKSIKTVGLITKRNIKLRKGIVVDLVKFLKKHKKKVLFDNNSCKLFKCEKGQKKLSILNKVDLAIVLGGDGTILKTARRLPKKKTLILGVNMGNLGFLSECHPDKLYECLEKTFEGNYWIDKRALLRVTIYRHGKKIETYLTLNDAVINQGAFARLIEMNLEVDNRKVVSIKADGMIVATPTGSTAHSLSAGGPIVHPDIQSLTVTPICPSSLSMRAIVISDNKQLTATIKTQRRDESAIIGLTLDGQDMMVLHYGDKIKFRRSSRNIYFIRTKNIYYKILRNKLHWGEL